VPPTAKPPCASSADANVSRSVGSRVSNPNEPRNVPPSAMPCCVKYALRHSKVCPPVQCRCCVRYALRHSNPAPQFASIRIAIQSPFSLSQHWRDHHSTSIHSSHVSAQAHRTSHERAKQTTCVCTGPPDQPHTAEHTPCVCTGPPGQPHAGTDPCVCTGPPDQPHGIIVEDILLSALQPRPHQACPRGTSGACAQACR
jgi:hypothetical protein